jgi:HlyD family secretion protein
MRIGGDWAVYAQEDGRAILRRVTLGARNDMAAAVLSGLKEGAEVILHPSDTVVDGGRVTP